MLGLGSAKRFVQSIDPRTGSVYGDPFAQEMAARAEIARETQVNRIAQDLRGRLGSQSPDYDSVAKSIAGHLKVSGHAGEHGAPGMFSRAPGIPDEGDNSVADIKRLLMMNNAKANRDKEALIMSAAYNSRPNAQTAIHQTLARQDWVGRTAQTGLAVGAVGGTAAGLTAAGQGLVQLMAYLQEGQSTAAERNNELT